MEEKVIMAGFGGQGIMAIGKLLTYAGMLENKEVSWLPSYGPEMRGGTANCNVVVSDAPVASPVVNDATAVIVMNKPSLEKFEEYAEKDGSIFVNSSLIKEKVGREDVKTYYIPANELANDLGNAKVANVIMLGAYLEITKAVDVESILKAFLKVFGESKSHLLDINRKALEVGAKAVQN